MRQATKLNRKAKHISHSVAIAIVQRMSRTDGRYEALDAQQLKGIAAVVRQDRRGKLTLEDVIARLQAISKMGAEPR